MKIISKIYIKLSGISKKPIVKYHVIRYYRTCSKSPPSFPSSYIRELLPKPWRWKQYTSEIFQCSPTRQHNVTTQMTTIWRITAVETSKLALRIQILNSESGNELQAQNFINGTGNYGAASANCRSGLPGFDYQQKQKIFPPSQRPDRFLNLTQPPAQ